MKKKSLSVLIAVAMATTTFAPSAVAFADDQVAVTDTANAEEVKEAPASTYGVTYDTHIQKRGWDKSVKTVTGDEDDITKFTDAGTSGTIGKSLRVEAIKIKGEKLPEGASIEYKVHQQTFGWSKVAKDGAEAGVTGKGKRAEAIKVTLKGLPGYAIKYQVHVQKKGWMPAVVTENETDIEKAAVAGTTGQGLRIEAIRVQIVKTDAEKKAEVEAINAVAKAEASKTQEDVDAANKAIANVQDTKEKKDLEEKVAAIKIEEPIDVTPEEKAAKEAVDKLVGAANGELTTEEAVKAAEDLVAPAEEAVAKVQDEDVKTSLSEQIEAAKELIKTAKDKLNVEKLDVASVSAVSATGEKTALDGATVSRGSSFELTLNKDFDEATVTNSTIKLVKGNETMAISLPTINNGVISFKSLAVLDADAEYKVVVDGIKSKDGNETLTNKTVATFKTAQTVITKKVVANSQKIYDTSTNDGVSLNVSNSWEYGEKGSSFEVTFDTPVDKSTINSKSIQLIDVTTGKNIAVEGNQDEYTNVLKIKVVGTKDYLTPKHQYKLVLDGLKAANGQDIDVFSLTFAYQAGKPVAVDETDIYNGDMKRIDNFSPYGLVNPLTTSKMLDNGSTFKAAAAVTIDFGAANVKLDESTVTTDYLYIREKDTHKKVPQKISYNKELNRVTLTPTENLKDDTTYEVYESPYIKNIYGITLGSKDSEYKTVEFKTLDVTAPTVAGEAESTLEDKKLTNLPTDKTFKIRLKMSEKIGNVSLTTDAIGFATGSVSGNILVTRADDENTSAFGVNVEKVVIGKDEYIELTIDPTKYNRHEIEGKTFRVTLAGTNPNRKNSSNKVITDAYSPVANAMANDYSFTYTFEGEDKVAPKITDIKAINGGELTSLEGMTNVNLGKALRVYFDSNDVNNRTLISGIKLYDKDNVSYEPQSVNYVSTGSTSYADVTFGDVAEGTVTLKAQNIKDINGNGSSLQSFDFIAGQGPMVGSVRFEIPEGGTSADSYVYVELPNKIDTTTLKGNIKLMNGDKEIESTIDVSTFEDGYVKVIPSNKLNGNTKYTLVISKNVKDTNGNCLQQNGDVAPADYKVDITTKDDAQPAINGDVTYKDGKLTVPFNTKIGSIDGIRVKNTKNGKDLSGEETGASVNSDGNVEVSFTKLDKNVQYDVELQVCGENGQHSIVITTFTTDADYNKDTTEGQVLTAKVNDESVIDGTKYTINNDAAFNLKLSEYVDVSLIKALKITNVGGQDYTPDVIYTEGLDKDGKETSKIDDIVYAKEFVLDVPGIYDDKAYEFRFTLAKDAKLCLGVDDNGKAIFAKSANDIKFILKTDKKTDTAAKTAGQKDIEAVETDLNTVKIGESDNTETITITKDGAKSLVKDIKNDTTITWTSSNPSIAEISESQDTVTFTRSAEDNDDDEVTITAKCEKNGKSETKVFKVIIKEAKAPVLNINETESSDANNLYIGSDEDVTLNVLTEDKTTVTDAAVDEDNGMKITSAIGAQSEQGILIKATDNAGNESKYLATFKDGNWTIAIQG